MPQAEIARLYRQEFPIKNRKSAIEIGLARHPAVDRQDLPGDVGSSRAGQEQDAGGNVVGRSQSGSRDTLFDFADYRIAQRLGHVAFDKSRGNGINRDLSLRQLLRKRSVKPIMPAFVAE